MSATQAPPLEDSAAATTATNLPGVMQPDDILVHRQTPLGMVARHLPLLEERLLKYLPEYTRFSGSIEQSNTFQILVARSHGDTRKQFCQVWKEQLAIAREKAAKMADQAPSSQQQKQQQQQQDEALAPPRPIELTDHVPVTVQVLLAAALLNTTDLTDKDLPKHIRESCATTQLPGETLEHGLGVQILPEPKGPCKTITIGRLQRALCQEWLLSPGDYQKRHDELLVAIGSPFDVNVLSWRCTGGATMYKVPISGSAYPHVLGVEEEKSTAYEVVSMRWTLDTFGKCYKHLVKVHTETGDDVL